MNMTIIIIITMVNTKIIIIIMQKVFYIIAVQQIARQDIRVQK